jgi:uncharacterized protein YxeA
MKKILIAIAAAALIAVACSFTVSRSDYKTVSGATTFYGDSYRVDKLNIDGRTFYVFTTDKGAIEVIE